MGRFLFGQASALPQKNQIEKALLLKIGYPWSVEANIPPSSGIAVDILIS